MVALLYVYLYAKENFMEFFMVDFETRLVDLEMLVTEQERTIQDLNGEVARISRVVDTLLQQQKVLINMLNEMPVKPLSEETPPPHY